MITEKKREKRSDREAKVASIVILVISLIAMFITDRLMLSLGLGILGAIIYFIFLRLIHTPERARKRKIEFYEHCVSAGIKKINNEKNLKRAELIAEKLNLTGIDVARYFDDGRKYKNELYVNIVKESEEERINEIKKCEKEQYNELIKYANLSGNDKTIAILTDKLKEATQRYSVLSNFEQNASDVFLEKEMDWAVHGGIASGIAGGAAGIATALNVQAENEEIKKRNAEKIKMISEASPYINEQADKSGSEYWSLRYKLDDEKIKLVGEMPAGEVLGCLKFETPQIDISETGTITVNVGATMCKEIKIYDDVPAKVDGTIIAKIISNGNIVGEMLLVLPLYGIMYGTETELIGMLLNAGVKGTSYEVEFEATHLYAVEC